MNKTLSVKNLTISGLMLALALVLPFLTGQIPQVGSALSPMHIPVLLCGFICGGVPAMIVGAIAPLLRFVLFGMPPLFPTGIAMCFELAAYGLLSGIFYRAFPKKVPYLYLSLVLAMVCGRLVWGAARLIMMGLGSSSFSWAVFLSGAVTNAIPGIILHIVLIPIIVLALRRAKVITD
ncbi:MAG: ECF transporter S component [Eubacteriales bacterium]|nr:ECF transporter S component [Eubacteriales bacterium]MDD3882937.1 ECF transporter S component [Eubacteriales bacterium]MDD4513516.1 ECF transporter S component [Eubacteriales bacterium]